MPAVVAGLLPIFGTFFNNLLRCPPLKKSFEPVLLGGIIPHIASVDAGNHNIFSFLGAGRCHGTGTVIRPETLRRHAREAGFSGVEILPIEHDFWRFYRLLP
jgi:hypothetical protein